MKKFTDHQIAEAKQRMVETVRLCLLQMKAKNLSNEEIERCMKGRAAEGVLVMYAKQFRDERGILDFPNLLQLQK